MMTQATRTDEVAFGENGGPYLPGDSVAKTMSVRMCLEMCCSDLVVDVFTGV